MFGNYFNDKRVLITGATGFKGSWLSIWLNMLGAKVYGYSLEPNSLNDNYVICGIEDSIVHECGDIRDLEKLTAFMKKAKPEIVYHLAAQPLVLASYKDPIFNYSTNVMGTVNILEAVRMVDSVVSVVNVTTDKVYKNVEQIWGYKENDELAGKDPYSASKSCSELITSSYVYSFFGNRDIRIATARAGNVIGGGDWADNRIVPDFYRALIDNKSLVLRNPYATRPWQHVLESLFGYLELGRSLGQSAKYVGAWNFGPYNSIVRKSVGDLVDKLIEQNPTVAVEKLNKVQEEKESQLLSLDVTKSTSLLNWKPLLSFDETVAYTNQGYQADIQRNGVMDSRIHQIENYQQKIRTEF